MASTIEKVKQQILDLTLNAVGEKIEASKLEITLPPNPDWGDFAVPCFYLTKVWRRSPNQIADDLKAKIRPAGLIKSVQNIGPYLNFYLDYKFFGEAILKEIKEKKDNYGRLNLSREKMMLEYSQPNTHKEFHVGHLRNAVLGSALARLYGFVGYDVLPVNYIGDIGAHVAKCLWALKKFHGKEKPPTNKGEYLGKIYAEAAQKTEVNEKYKAEADAVLQKLETGDKKWLALWQKTRNWSLADFKEIYKVLDCRFAKIFYESEVEKPGKKIVADLLKRGLAEKSEGAVVINLEKYGLKVFLLLKSDGSSLYSTKDLALAQLKFKKYKIDQSLVVTDSRQSFYFQQLFKTLELLGFKEKTVHVPYEFVTLSSGAMASRRGNVILFNDFYQQVCAQAEAETKKRHANWPAKKVKAVANKIALAAIKFNLLKTGNGNVIVFDIKEALSFEGFSGPYLLYTISRIGSVLKKAKLATRVDYQKLNSDLEKQILLKLAYFPAVVKEAAISYQLSEVAQYLFDLARLFSGFYQSLPILNSPAGVRSARLALIAAVRQTLVNGCRLLGLTPVDKM